MNIETYTPSRGAAISNMHYFLLSVKRMCQGPAPHCLSDVARDAKVPARAVKVLKDRRIIVQVGTNRNAPQYIWKYPVAVDRDLARDIREQLSKRIKSTTP